MTIQMNEIDDYFSNHDYLSLKEAKKIGLSSTELSSLVKKQQIERIRHGVYVQRKDILDEYEILQYNSNMVIYSYGTALYFHDLSDRVPNVLHITLPQGYNASRIKRRNDVVVHYVKKEIHSLGMERIRSSLGGAIVVYDKERCICDLIKHKNKIDSQLYIFAIKSYFQSKDKDLLKLLEYAKKLGIEQKVRSYMEVM